MDNSNITKQAVELVEKAVTADEAGEAETALGLYRDALSRFTIAIKYERNEARKKLLMQRMDGYLNRAEELKAQLDSKSNDASHKPNDENKSPDGSTKADDIPDATKKELDEDTKKIRGVLSGVILAEKPDVQWDDVAGLENAVRACFGVWGS